jgi:hypothetical protein
MHRLSSIVRRCCSPRALGKFHGAERYVALLVGASILLVSCEPKAPPRWAEGGAPLALTAAHWQREDEVVEIRPGGEVYVDGDHVWTLDRAGRVVDDDNEAVAILFPDGALVGPDDTVLGHVGLRNAAPPFHSTAWLSLANDGTVIRFDSDGDREGDGKWKGCVGAALRTCTLVTQLVALRNYARQPSTSVGVGIGIGF